MEVQLKPSIVVWDIAQEPAVTWSGREVLEDIEGEFLTPSQLSALCERYPNITVWGLASFTEAYNDEVLDGSNYFIAYIWERNHNE